MAIEIGELRGILTLQDQFSKPIDDAAKGLGVFSQSFGAVSGAAGLAIGVIGATAAAIVALGTHGAEVADVQQAFEGLTRRAGESADVMLGALQKGTLGTISNFELMKLANGVLGTGLVTSAEQMGTLAAGAQLLADRTGGTTAEAFKTLTSAMETGKTAALKQAGIFANTGDAVDNYARSLHKNVSDLSDHQKATAQSQAVLAGVRQELGSVGGATRDFGDNLAHGRATLENFTNDLGVAIATSPVLKAAMETMGKALDEAFGSKQGNAVKVLMGFVGEFAIGLVKMGEVAVEVGRFATLSFFGLRAVFNGFLETLATGVSKITDVLATIAGGFPEIPGMKTLADGLQGVHDLASSAAEGFKELTDKAVRGGDDAAAGFDKARGFLDNLESSMQKALTTQNDTADAAPAAAAGYGKITEAAHLTEAQVKALEEATRKGQEAMAEAKNKIASSFQELQDQLTIANKTGLDQRLTEIQLAQEKEVAGYQWVAFTAPESYDLLVAAVQEKYGLMTAAAAQSFADQATAAVGSADTQERAAQQTLMKALSNYQELLASGVATYEQLTQAAGAAYDASKELDDLEKQRKLEQFELIAGSASTILKSLFGKSKTAAIAAAIIDTLSAIAKALGAYPWPWSLAPAAAAAAAGYANVNKIRSTDAGFAQGTPDTSFLDFGRGSLEMLHGPEAVVTKAQGESLAEMIRQALSSGPTGFRDPETISELRGLRADLLTLPRILQRAVRDGVLLAT